MTKQLIIVLVAAMGFSLGAVRAAAQGPQGAGISAVAGGESSHASRSLNPVKWIKKDSKTAAERLDANKDQDKKLTSKLQAQGVLPAKADLKDVCAVFKDLEECIAGLHASHNLGIRFKCMRWALTGVQPGTDLSSCTAPPRDNGVSLSQAIRLLKPGANAKAEAKKAEKQAHEEVKEARS